MRTDGRKNDELRKIDIQMNFLKNAEASCLVSFGNTRIICTASCSEGVPPFLLGQSKGWVTAEYAMLPGSTPTRKKREVGKQDGRSVEIQRLIGRALRCVTDFNKFPGYTINIDCDVIDADGGTRTASITGAWCVLYKIFEKMISEGKISENPLTGKVAAVSCGIVEDEILIDLSYSEDSNAQTDMNIVMTSNGGFVEVQGTGEGREFTMDELMVMLDMAKQSINKLFIIQEEAINR